MCSFYLYRLLYFRHEYLDVPPPFFFKKSKDLMSQDAEQDTTEMIPELPSPNFCANEGSNEMHVLQMRYDSGLPITELDAQTNF